MMKGKVYKIPNKKETVVASYQELCDLPPQTVGEIAYIKEGIPSGYISIKYKPLIEDAVTQEELMLMGNEVPLEGTEEMVIKYANTNSGCKDLDDV